MSKRREGKRKEKIGWPQREKREKTKLPSLISTGHVIITSEFSEESYPTITALRRKQDFEAKS